VQTTMRPALLAVMDIKKSVGFALFVPVFVAVAAVMSVQGALLATT
jgi:hypothetical protein